jgi:hypothetical protein
MLRLALPVQKLSILETLVPDVSVTSSPVNLAALPHTTVLSVVALPILVLFDLLLINENG